MDLKIDPQLLVSQALHKTPDAAHNERDAEKLRATCQDFEALFIHAMLKEMRKTIPQDGLLPRGMGEDAFQEVADWEVAQQSARTGHLGVAEALFRQLNGMPEK